MVFRFPSGKDVIVAIHAWANDFIVVDYIDGHPIVDVVTGFAKVRGRYMSCGFTCRSDIIMTGCAALVSNY